MSAAAVEIFTVKRGRISVECFPTPVPGLVINRDPDAAGTFNVTHARSGAAVAHVPDPEFALHVAIKLGELTDWTRSGIELRRSKKVTRACKRVLRETGAAAYGAGAVPTPTAALVQLGERP